MTATRRCVGALGGLAVAVLAVGGGCTTYSSFQSAKLLDPGQTSLTVALSSSSYAEGGDSSGQELGELMVRHGFGDTVEGGVRVSRLNFDTDGAFFYLVDGKLELIPEILSVALPVGGTIITGDSVDSDHLYVAQPSLFYRVPISQQLDLELAGKWIILVDNAFEDSNTALATTVGVRFSDNLTTSRWWIQPEFGLYIDPGEEGHARQIGIGFTYLP